MSESSGGDLKNFEEIRTRPEFLHALKLVLAELLEEPLKKRYPALPGTIASIETARILGEIAGSESFKALSDLIDQLRNADFKLPTINQLELAAIEKLSPSQGKIPS